MSVALTLLELAGLKLVPLPSEYWDYGPDHMGSLSLMSSF